MAIAAGVIGGDNRTFSANAPYGASRVQVYLDLDNLQGVFYPTASTAYIPLPTVGAPYIFPYIWPVSADPQPHLPKSLNMTQNADGTVTVDMKFWNGFCPTALLAVCPAIDASIIFTKVGGAWTTSERAISRDNYPSMGVYNEGAGGSFTPVYEDPEGHFSALWGVDRMIQKLREKRDEQLGSCQLE